MSWIVAILNISLFIGVILYFYVHSGSLRKYVLPAVFIKILAGIGVGLLYKFYYGYGDTLIYFNEAENLVRLAKEDFFVFTQYLFSASDEVLTSPFTYQPRSLFFVKILSVVNILTYSNYWLSTVYFSLFSFSGMWFLAKSLTKLYPMKVGSIVLALLYFPSAVFWSAGIIKESIAMGCIGFIVGVILYIVKNQTISWKLSLIMVVNAIILWHIKYYYAGVIFLILVSMLATLFFTIKLKMVSERRWLQLIVFVGLSVGMAAIVSLLHPNFYPERFLGVVVSNYEEYVLISNKGDYVSFDGLMATWSSVAFNVPKALFSGLFRPMIGESAEVLKILVGIEHLLLLLFTFYSLMQVPKKLSNTDFLLLIGAISFVGITAIFLTLSAPNFGSLIRYKSGIMPFYVLIITIRNPYIEKLMHRLF
jgi:hypothetical protein